MFLVISLGGIFSWARISDAPASPGILHNRSGLKDADAATLRRANRAAPQEIMIEFVGSRLLERMDVATLRIDRPQKMLLIALSLPDASMP